MEPPVDSPGPGERPTPPSTVRVVWLMTAMHLNRWSARVVAQMNRPRKKKGDGARPARAATPGKASSRWPLLILLGLMMVFCSANIWRQLVVSLGAELELPKPTTVSNDPFERLAEQHARRNGTRFQNLLSLQPIWPSAAHAGAMTSALGLIFAGLAVTQFLIGLGYTNKDLGKVEWHMEWLFTMPAPARTLFFGQLPGLVLSDAWVWLMSGPLLAVVYYSTGWGWLSAPLAAAATAYLCLLICSLRMLLETALRMRFGAGGLKNSQAACTILGLGCYFGLMYLVLSPDGIGVLAEAGRNAPAALLVNPFVLPVLFATQAPVAEVVAFLGMAAYGVALPAAALGTAGWLVRGGLIARGDSRQGTRGAAGRRSDRPVLFTGVIGKELTGFFRDRNLLVQVLLLPLFLFGFYILLSPGGRQVALANAGGTAALAFGFGAYMVLTSAGFGLAFEGGALWLLYTFPHRLSSVLFQKAALWSSLAVLFTAAAMIVAVCFKPDLAADLPLPGLFALIGVPIMGMLAAGLGALSTDPFQSEMQRRVRPEFQYLYLLVAAIFGSGVALPGVWPKLVTTTLTVLAAFAVWQQVTARLPFLLDPSAQAPRRIALADGLVAALAFFGLQQMIGQLLHLWGFAPTPALVIAYSVSGLLVVIFALAAFFSAKMTGILAATGLRSGPEASGTTAVRWLGAVGTGLAAGVAAAAAGLGYLAYARYSGWIPTEAVGLGAAKEDQRWLLILTMVGAAPLFEEFIFRGLVYRGLRSSLPVVLAAAVSAAVFAMVHPPPSAAPVFVLGLATAFAFERTGLLLAPILTHMVYNASVLFLA
jgi:membrane protease YdiL (CAAX protease family)